jgi:hypothetical protein
VELSEPDEATIVRVAAAHLDPQFPSVDTRKVESVVRGHVRNRLQQARIRNFVGILAERDARADLQRTVSI